MKNKLAQTASRLGIKPEEMPRHIAIIMDGNGRWAKKRGLLRPEGHRQGAVTAEKISHLCVEFGIEALTLYSFSIENWKRPMEEVDALMHLYTEYLVKMRPKLMEDNAKLVHLGRIGPLPDAVKTELLKTIEMTSERPRTVKVLRVNFKK